MSAHANSTGKSFGLVVTALAFVSVLGSIATGYWVFDQEAGQQRSVRPLVPTVVAPRFNEGDLARFEQYESSLNRAIGSKRESLDGQKLQMFGYQEVSLPVDVDQPAPIHKLSMVYESNGHHYAVIDNRLYKKGQRLPSGAQIKQIKMSGVVIVKDGIGTILSLGNPISAPIGQSLSNNSASLEASTEHVAKAIRQMNEIQRAIEVLRASTQAAN